MKHHRAKESKRGIEERNRLVAEHWESLVKLVAKIARRKGWADERIEEAIADAAPIVLRAAEIWDESRGVKFTTYAGHAVIRRLTITRLRNRTIPLKEIARKGAWSDEVGVALERTECASLDRLNAETRQGVIDRHAPNPMAEAGEKDERDWLARFLRDTILTEREREALEAFLAEEPTRATAARLGVSKGRITELTRKVRRELKAEYERRQPR